MSTGLIETIKTVALNAFESSKPVKLLFGKVISTNPIKVKINDTLTLTKEFLVINGSVSKNDKVTVIQCQGGQKYVVLGSRIENNNNPDAPNTNVSASGGVTNGSVVDKAIAWALQIAGDSSHGYDQGSRWGPDYDCSSFVITAYEQAGVPVKSKGGATYTGNMRTAFLNYGFKDVTSSINLSNGSGLQKGDVLLNTAHHTAMFVSSNTIVHASINENGKATGGQKGDQTGKEICTRTYYNYPWNYVLRYSE